MNLAVAFVNQTTQEPNTPGYPLIEEYAVMPYVDHKKKSYEIQGMLWGAWGSNHLTSKKPNVRSLGVRVHAQNELWKSLSNSDPKLLDAETQNHNIKTKGPFLNLPKPTFL